MTTHAITMTTPDANHSFGEELGRMVFDGRRRAHVRARLLRRLDQQIAAVKQATDSDIEHVEQETQGLIEFTETLLALGILASLRDPGQHQKIKHKLDALVELLRLRPAILQGALVATSVQATAPKPPEGAIR